jgi:hypothetical protein
VTVPAKTRADVPGDGRPHGSDAVLLSVALVAVSTSGPLIAATAALSGLALVIRAGSRATAPSIPVE